ncbi:MAG: DUF6183 family protein [Actinomycetota bacterium]|nr:DUF6183 family protein [Actinomycetota bacterium]
MEHLQQLVDAADTAALLHAVDGLCAGREWDRLADLARRCRDAVELGKQLWSVAMHIDYRLAWEGPASHAAAVLRPGAGRFVLGPLTEVAASTHDWSSLAPHLPDPISAAAVAGERVLRGEDLRGAQPASLLETAELPLVLAGWEPAYALPTYRDRSALFPRPDATPTGPPRPATTPRHGRSSDDEAVRALRDVVEAWVSQSSGRVDAVAVEGPAEAAVGALAPQGLLYSVDAAQVLAILQWAGASGGAYGRRRGGAAGRFTAWWVTAAAAGLQWPADAGDLQTVVDELRWYVWSAPGDDSGWVLRVAIADPVDGLAWAVDASDRRDEEAAWTDALPPPAT